MERKWFIREYKDSDEEALLELNRTVYGDIPDKDQWMRQWRWIYRDNPGGAGQIWLACDRDKVVGRYGLIFMRLKLGNQIMQASQNIDQMTHPDYRFQGIARNLAMRALGEAEAKGITIITGFANESSHVVDLKTGYFDLCPLRTMIKPINIENILIKYSPSKSLARFCSALGNLAIKPFSLHIKGTPKTNGLTIKKISRFDERINDFWEKVCHDYPIIVARDREYLNWRYVNIPNIDYTIYIAEKDEALLGYIVLRSKQQRGLTFGYIFDLLVPLNRQDIAYHLLSRAIEHFKEARADLVFYQMIGPKAYYKTFSRMGFIYSRFLSKRFKFVVHVNTPETLQVNVKDPEQWFVQIGDSDTL